MTLIPLRKLETRTLPAASSWRGCWSTNLHCALLAAYCLLDEVAPGKVGIIFHNEECDGKCNPFTL